MTRTNFEKLVRWDADYYKELTDDDCIVCLTEREVYIIGQIIDMIRWSRTRWIGDLLGLDFDLIAGNLEYKLAERMTCQNIGDLLQKINQLAPKIEYIFNETVINEGDTVVTPDTAPYDVHTPEEFAEEFSIATDGCDDADKDALYAGIRQFVLYVNQANIDALQNIKQAGNLASQAKRLLSGIPVLGLLPFDEVADYTAFLMDELLDEYEATVDETLLETVTCDLFCIAVSSNCTFNYSDAINYYGSKIGSTLIDLYSSLANVVQFATTGTFSGDEYFYFMSTFQFIAVAVSSEFFSTNGIDEYMLQVAAGMNSPDNDWTLLCDECPPLYRLWTQDFATGLGAFVLNSGTLYTGGRIQGVGTDDSKLASITLPDHDATDRVRAIRVTYERTNGDGVGGLGHNRAEIYVNGYSSSNLANCGEGLANGSDLERAFDNVTYISGGTSLGFFFVADTATADIVQIYIDKIEVLYTADFAPVGAVITETDGLCP